MFIDVKIPPYTIKAYQGYDMQIFENTLPFPVMGIDVDSYVVQAKIHSPIEFSFKDGVHNVQIGKYCALAENISFLVNLNHNYQNVCVGALSVCQNRKHKERMKRKGQIIVQNDCWVGNGVTIMGGVTIHNGAIVATQAVVTKDVPPYAIVAGNPARIIKYRFDEQRIAELQKIAWWDWDSTKIEENAELFYDDALVFIQKHIAFAEQQLSEIPELPMDRDAFEEIYLFIPDFNEPYPIYPKVFTEFLTRFTSEKYQLLVYFEDDTNIEENMSKIDRIASCYPESNCCINFCYPKINDERSLFKAADYFITTRAKENVRRMCFADLFDVTCISGVDDPIFSELI